MNNYPMPGPAQNGMPNNHPVPYGQPSIPSQQQDRSMTALGITALVLGIVAVSTSFLPIINNLSFFIGLLGLIFGIIGLVACIRGTKKGRGVSIAGIVLCAVSLVVVLVAQSMFSAAVDESLSSTSLSSSGASTAPSAATSASGSASSTTSDAKYVVSIDDCALSTDYQGADAAVVTFTFTNNSDKDTSFMVATTAQAFQNGVQLETAIGAGQDSGSTMKEIKPGATVTVSKGYVLSDMSPLTVEVEELMSFSDDVLAEKTFALQ